MRTSKWVIGGLACAAAAAFAWWWQRSRGLEAELLAEAPYQVLKQHEPAEFARVLAGYREFKSGHRGQAEFVRESNALYSQAATRRLANASQGSLQALMHDTLRTVKKLREKSPEACFRYFYPEVAGPPDVAGILSAEEQRTTLRLMGEVVRSAAEYPVTRPAPQEVQDELAGIINATYEQYGADAQMAAHAADPRIDRGKVCAITTSLYERILALPPDVSTRLIRYMAPQRDP
jgi:hypothetical protein